MTFYSLYLFLRKAKESDTKRESLKQQSENLFEREELQRWCEGVRLEREEDSVQSSMENGWCFSDMVQKKWVCIFVCISKEDKFTERGKQNAFPFSYLRSEYEKCFVIFKKLI